MRVVFAGTPEVALPSLEALLASSHEVLAVVTRPDAPAGRGRHLEPSPIAERAAEHGIEVLKPASTKEPEFVARLTELVPECCPVVAYGALLRQELLDLPPHGWVNLHFSLLPNWRGAAPVQHAIRAGDELTGATTFRIVRELDAGPTFGTMTEPIRADDTAGALLDRLARGGARLLVDTLDGIETDTVRARPQPAAGTAYAGKITVEDARVDWDLPAFAIDRLVRSCTPAPGAWTTLHDERLKLGPVRVRDDAAPLEPGALDIGKKVVLVGTRTAAVELTEVQPRGRRTMRAADWARGLHLDGAERLR